MRGHLLGDLQPSTVPEIRGNAGGAEGMTADLGLDPSVGSSPANHPPYIRLEQRIASQLPLTLYRAFLKPAARPAIPPVDNLNALAFILEVKPEV